MGKEVISTESIGCRGFKSPDNKSVLRREVGVIVTTFSDAATRVSCPYIDDLDPICHANEPKGSGRCPYKKKAQE